MRFRLRALVVALPLLATAAMADDAKPRFGARGGGDLHAGENRIENFTPDGRPAMFLAALDVDGAKRSPVYMVLLRSNPGAYRTDWQIAGIETAPGSGVFADSIRDDQGPRLEFDRATLDRKPE